MTMTELAYHRPRTLDEALALARALPGARYLAGGTDLLVKVKDGFERPEALISLRGVAELTRIESQGEGLSIGAAVPLAEVEAHVQVRKGYPVLAAAIRSMGSEQIRQSGTLGGNICNGSPCADSAPPLFVLEAKVRVVGPEGERRLAMGDLMVGPKQLGLGPAEIVAAFELPRAEPSLRGVFLKKRRVAMDLALVNLAAIVCMSNHGRVGEEIRLCAGAVGPVPMRLTAVEQLLEGKQPSDALLAEARKLASESVQPISDMRAGADYRRHITGVFVERALRDLRGAHP